MLLYTTLATTPQEILPLTTRLTLLFLRCVTHISTKSAYIQCSVRIFVYIVSPINRWTSTVSIKYVFELSLVDTWHHIMFIATVNPIVTFDCREIFYFSKLNGGCPCGVMVKAMDCGIVVSEFVPQSRYYVHFRANTLGKGMNPLILPAMG